MEILLEALRGLWIFLPAYVANMAAVVVGGPPPIDLGRTWKDGRRILGDGKTWRGLLLSPLLSSFVVVPLTILSTRPPFSLLSLPQWGEGAFGLAAGYALGLGALLGDATKSFFKRRRGMDRGERWWGFDQLDFVVGALLVSYLFGALLRPGWFEERFTLGRIVGIVVLTPALHLAVNVLGYRMGKKSVPW